MANEPIVTSVAYRGMRNFKKASYHYCARCGSRVEIKEMVWQRGLLLCKKWDCIDTGNHGFPLIGQRESHIISVLDVPNSHEMQPDDKLITPMESGSNTDDEIYF
jgi:hypothetical protein